MDNVDDAMNDILEHHGVVGMKWGIRRDRRTARVASGTATRRERLKFASKDASTVSLVKNKGNLQKTAQARLDKKSRKAAAKAARKAPQPVTVKNKNGRLKTKGGQNQPPTAEALKTAEIRQKAKASGKQAVSNEELQVAVKRMNLEQQFTRLDSPPSAVGKFVNDLLKNQGNQQANKVANDKIGTALKTKK